MKITRFYTGQDGLSHFADADILLEKSGASMRSEVVKATGVIFRETSGDYDLGWHTAPKRQFVINLEGAVEIVASDGTKRIIRQGEIMLAEDTTGKGHVSRAVNHQPRRSIFVTLE